MNIVNVSEPIVRHYLNLVEANKKTIQEVPEKFRQEVADILNISLEELTLEETIEKKVAELSVACGQVITAGTDVTLSNGTKHYSFTSNDQNNIKNWFDVAVSTKTDGIPYHADGEECELYTYLDIIQLYIAEQKYILYHNTYFNMLKAMVKTLTFTEEVEAVVYGMELNEEFSEKMNTILTQSEEVFAKAMAAYGIDVKGISL